MDIIGKTISEFANLNVKADISEHREDVYLVSHPKNIIDGRPSEYATYKVPFKTLAQMFLDAVYNTEDGLDTLDTDGIIERVRSDLALGRFSHVDALSDSNQIVGDPICLSNINDVGPFAGTLDTLPHLKSWYYSGPNDSWEDLQLLQQYNNKFGFSQMAFMQSSELSLEKYAHSAVLCCRDFTDISASGFVGLSTPANLSTAISGAISSSLSLGDFAHINQITNNSQISGSPIMLSNIYNQETLLDNRYLSVASGKRGSVAVGYQTNASKRNYALSIDEGNEAGNAFTHVPWTDTSSHTDITFVAPNSNQYNKVFLSTLETVYRNGTAITSVENVYSTSVNIHIPNNITREDKANLTSYPLALFSDTTKNTLHSSSTATINPSNGDATKFLNEKGSFTQVQMASATSSGLMSKENYTYLNSTLPALIDGLMLKASVGASNAADGTQLAVSYNNQQKMVVNVPRASTDSYGAIRVGYQKNDANYPVQLDNAGRAYVNVEIDFPQPSTTTSTTPNNDFQPSKLLTAILDAVYPINSIYITAQRTDTCPLAANLKFGVWEKISGKYLLASGTLAYGETYQSDSYVAAGLPSHTHTYSFAFSSASSAEGYPHHGGKNTCKHSSNTFTTGGVSDGIYGASATVRPAAYVVTVFKRVR